MSILTAGLCDAVQYDPYMCMHNIHRDTSFTLRSVSIEEEEADILEVRDRLLNEKDKEERRNSLSR